MVKTDKERSALLKIVTCKIMYKSRNPTFFTEQSINQEQYS